jgi:hypothetical protein
VTGPVSDPSSSSVADWHAARRFPDAYPGDAPAGPFCLIDDLVAPMRLGADDEIRSLEVLVDGAWASMDRQLAAWDLPRLEDRVPIVAYGGNRNPATVALKCEHYGYHSTSTARVFPVLHGHLSGMDVVAGGLSDQGYLYADVHVGDEAAAGELSVEVWVMLLDDEGVRMLHDSEGVREGGYAVARVDGLQVGTCSGLGALIYASTIPVFSSPELGSPVAFSAVRATGRTLPAMTAVEMIEHVVVSLGVEAAVRRITGITADDLASELMKFLNGQFWYRRHTGRRRLETCEQVEALIWSELIRSTAPESTAERLRARGRVLETAEAYDVAARHRLRDWWR